MKNKFSHHRIVKRRKELGKTQEQMANEVGVSLSKFRRWEAGTGRPDMDNIGELRLALDCSFQFLFGLVEDPRTVGFMTPLELDYLLAIRELPNYEKIIRAILSMQPESADLIREQILMTAQAQDALYYLGGGGKKRYANITRSY